MQPDAFAPLHGGPLLRTAALILGVAITSLPAITAQDARAQIQPLSHVEAGTQYYEYDAGLGVWRGLYLHGTIQKHADDLWRLEAGLEERFGEQSFVYKVGHTRRLTDRSFGRASLSTSSGGFYNPRLRADVQLARKWGAERRLITLAGATFIDAKDVHRDVAGLLEAQLYLGETWVVQGGVRWNYSMPGGAWSRYHDVALTQGRSLRRYVTLRFAFGSEAYEVIDPLVTYTDFDSWSVSATWRQWIYRAWGFELRGEHYENPYYRRSGVQFGLFKQF